MAAWKQIVLALVVVILGGIAWIAFFPGASATLASLGVKPPSWAAGAETAQQGAGGQSAQGQSGQRGGQRGAAEVVAAAVTRATINDTLQAIGTGRANASVSVNPFVSGRIAAVNVKAGDTVKAGDVLVTLDSEVETIALDRAKVAVADADDKLKRVQTLRSARTATDVQVADARVVLSNAQLAQRDAELALERRSVLSPISGIVGILPVETGAYVTSQTAIATIDDRSLIKVDFWAPERFASQIAVGQPVTATSAARPGVVLHGQITAVDNRLDEASRTMQVQASIPNADDKLRAGMSFQVSMKFAGDAYAAVDPLAIQWSSDGAFVWQVKNGKAVRTPVRIVQRNTETVLVDGDLSEGQMVVTEGIHLVRDGGDVSLAQREQKSGAIEPVARGG